MLTQGCVWVNHLWREAAFSAHTQGGADAAPQLLAGEAAHSAPAQRELSSVAVPCARTSSPDFQPHASATEVSFLLFTAKN